MNERIRISVKTPESKEVKNVSKMKKTDLSQSTDSPVDRILFLQRTIGNQAIQRLIRSGTIQAKLIIGQPGDVYEQEADRVAEQVMRMPQPQAVSSGSLSIRRACPKCENDELKRQPIKEEDEEEKLQRKPVEEEEEELQAKAISGSIPEVNPDIESHIQSVMGRGKPLSENERAFFEPRFGQDFSQVRLHIGAQAAESAWAVNARAFTVGHNVVFGAGEYSSDSLAGRKLLAHELVHTVQQGGAGKMVQRTLKFVTNVPAKGGDCGTYSWGVQWKLTAPANKTNGGWVVQKIDVTPSGTKDDSTALTSVDRGRPSPKFPYWEAWRVNPGKNVTDFAEGGDPYDDTYGWSTQSPGSKGTESAKGDAQFYDNLNTLPTDFKKNNSDTYAGILYSTKTKPTLTGGTGEIDHTLVATWNCLKSSSNKETVLKVTPDP